MGKNNILEDKNVLVYRHRRLDNNQVFYIGIGGKNRPTLHRWLNGLHPNKTTFKFLKNG